MFPNFASSHFPAVKTSAHYVSRKCRVSRAVFAEGTELEKPAGQTRLRRELDTDGGEDGAGRAASVALAADVGAVLAGLVELPLGAGGRRAWEELAGSGRGG